MEILRATGLSDARISLVHLSRGTAAPVLSVAAGLVGTSVGLTQLEKFRVASDSAAGLEVLGEHFDAGEAQPILVVTDTDHAEQVLAATAEVTGLGMPLYARIDLVDTAAHGLVLLEAELFEPLFNLHLVPEVAEVFAEATLARTGSGDAAAR